MGTPNILLTRVDNRLVHGQVGMTWANTLGANLIVVANDQVAADPVQQNLMDMVVPETVKIRYFTIEKTINIIHKAAPHQKIIIVVKTPHDALKLIEGGVPVKELNVGNMHFTEGKKQMTSTVYVDAADAEVFRRMHALGVKMEIKGVPSERAYDMAEVLAKNGF
jgi:PTS system N-acetylgalactosamine-specific IIB component